MTAERCDTDTDGMEPSPASPGEKLREARERAGLGIRQVAESLRLLPDQITALEEDNFERFGNPIFCRGHLRAYGRLLGIDADELVQLYQQRGDTVIGTAGNIGGKVGKVNVAPIQRPARGHSFRYWGLALVIILSGALWYTQDHREDVSPDVATSLEVDRNDQSSLQTLEEQGKTAGVTPSVQAQSQSASGAVADFQSPEQDPVVLDLPANGHGAAVAKSVRVDSSAGGSDVLDFSFTDDCWVEVTDGNGELIYANLKRGKEKLELTGTGPFKVLLGYAHGVSLDYNGKPVQIDIKSRNNSARLVVGNIPVQ